MSQEINKEEKQDLSLVVRAIGSDLEHTQVRMIASANADMLFHYWKVGHFILYLVKVRKHNHAVGHCYRCNTVIEPRVSRQWFVKMAPLAASSRV